MFFFIPAWSVRIALFCLLVSSLQAAPADLDSTFGSPGRVLTSFQPLNFVDSTSYAGPASAHAVMELPDGKMMAAGHVGDREVACARYNLDGTLDKTFGIGGVLNFSHPFLQIQKLTGIARQSDGKIVLAGSSAFPYSAFLLRVSPDGGPDSTFGQGGIFILPGTEEAGNTCLGVAVQGDDKIVLVGGHAYDTDFLVARVSANGQLDATFGNGGVVTVPFAEGGAGATCVKIQTSGRIVVGGTRFKGADADFALACLLADGSLDVSFGEAGKLSFDLGSSDDSCLSIALREDGKVVAAGMTSNGGQQDAILIACDEHGVLDSAFGTDGQVVTSLSTGPERLTAVMVRADGKIVAAGESLSAQGVNQCAVLRFRSDGTADASFGTGGRVFCQLGSLGGAANAACLAAGGKIVVAGTADQSMQADFLLARFLEDGRLDGGFGSGWMASTFDGYSTAVSVSVQSDGKFLVSGSVDSGNTARMCLARYEVTGELDKSFGTQGRVTTSFSPAYGYDVAVQPDGRIIMVGVRWNEKDWVVLRFLANGSLDSTFGTGGRVTTGLSTGLEYWCDVALQPDGKIVVAGTLQIGTDYDFAMVRYDENGILDPSFGSGGKVITGVGPGADVVRTLAIQPDGSILVAGKASNGANLDFALVRYLSNGSLDPGFGVGGKTMTAIDLGDDTVWGMALQEDGKVVLVGRSGPLSGLGAPSAKSTMVRYLSNGTLDPGFGVDGTVVIGINNQAYRVSGVALQADGRIVTVGTASSFASVRVTCLVRHNEDGTLDGSFGTTFFGTHGAVMTALGGLGGAGNGVVAQDDGTVVVVGNILKYGGAISEWFLARYKSGPLLPMLGGVAAVNFSTGSTSVNGTVKPHGSTTTAHVEYGPTAAYGSVASISLSPADGMTVQDVSAGLSGLTPGTTYHYRLTASNAAGTRSTPGSTFTTLTLHQGWRQQHFGLSANTGNAADTYDFDGDGLPNLLEWATALNPTASSRLAHATRLEGGELEFNYARSVPAVSAGTLFCVEWSESLLSTSWSTVGVIQTVLSDDGVTQQVKAVLPAGETGRRFVRLKVESP